MASNGEDGVIPALPMSTTPGRSSIEANAIGYAGGPEPALPVSRGASRMLSHTEARTPAYGRSWSRIGGYGSSMPDGTVITISRRPSSVGLEPDDPERLFRVSAATPLLEGHDPDRLSTVVDSGEGTPRNAEEDPGETEYEVMHGRIAFAMNASLVANVLLLVAKVVAFFLSSSKAVLASAADSFVDIASQVVLAIAEHKMKRQDPRFPVGRTRLEAVGVVSCAVIMTLATIEVIQSAAGDLWVGFCTGVLPPLEVGLLMYIILGSATAIKIALLIYCQALSSRSDSIAALAEDHRNDIASNLGAIICGGIASFSVKVWWVDPAGAILISFYIINSWAAICKNQMDKIVGAAAPADFVEHLQELANAHHDLLEVDVIRAFHWGARFIVEMEVVMPETMTVRESHDIALVLQHKLEAFDEVERAFVHVDYERRLEPEHKVDRNLAKNVANLFEQHPMLKNNNSGITSHSSGSVASAV